MSDPGAYVGERSADKRTAWFAILLLNILVAATSLVESRSAPGFILTTTDGTKVHATALQSSKFSIDDEEKGFDVRTRNGITRRIPYDLNGVQKMEILNFKDTKPKPTPILDPWTSPSPIASPSVVNSPTPVQVHAGDEYEVNVRIESGSGELIEGVATIKAQFVEPPDSLPTSFVLRTDKGEIQLNALNIKSIERESSVLYEWSKRLF